MEEMQQSQAENLMSVLQIEMNMEATRQARLAATVDPEEREMLNDLFDAQRLASQGRIANLVAADKKKLSEKVGKFVKHKKVADKVADFSVIGSIVDNEGASLASSSQQSDGVPKQKMPSKFFQEPPPISPTDFMVTKINVSEEA